MKELEGYLVEAVGNIRNDRKLATQLLEDVAKYIGGSEERHKDVGVVAAKYMETLQRSNEQLVKIVGLMEKANRGSEGLSEEDKDDLFDFIESEKNKDKEENK